MFTRIKTCRACQGTDLVKVLSIGVQPLANDFQKDGGECAGYAPLEVLFCRTCTLAQLSVVVRPEVMYSNYSYVTSASDTMKAHFAQLIQDIRIETKNHSCATMLEIGSNNGEFLLAAKEEHFDGLGIEPAKNIATIAKERGVKTIDRMWGEPSGVELGATGYKADVVVARHVFAHVDDWKGFIHALEFVTHKDSLVVIEVPYVGDMLKMNSFDQIYHEHLSYVSITAIHRLLNDTQFVLQDVKNYSIHGGAIALMIRRKDGNREWRINPEWHSKFEEKDLEQRWNCLDTDKRDMCTQLCDAVYYANKKGKKICGFGASAKATVWCNAAGLTAKDIAFICDSTEQKRGKLVPGTDIPVAPESWLLQADCACVFSWNFFLEIRAKFKAFEDKGGRWILPVPNVRIIE